jgi:nucleotide-binding universal stress UspA family protein
MTGKSIIVPTDFSRDAAEALHYASVLARTLDKPISLVHVKPSSILPHAHEDIDDPSEAVEQAKLEALKPEGPHIDFERQFLHGNPSDAILQFAYEHHAGLIVMGSHGRTDAPDQPIGSIAAAVLHRSRVPVICVKAPSPAEASIESVA